MRTVDVYLLPHILVVLFLFHVVGCHGLLRGVIAGLVLDLAVGRHLGEFGLGSRQVSLCHLATEIEVLRMLGSVSHTRSRLMQTGHTLVRVLGRFLDTYGLLLHGGVNNRVWASFLVDFHAFFLEFLFGLKTIGVEFPRFTVCVDRLLLGDLLRNEQTITLFIQLLPGISDGVNDLLHLPLLLIFFFNTEISKLILDLIIDFHGSFATAKTACLLLLVTLVNSFELSRYEAFLNFFDVSELGFRLLVAHVIVFLFRHVDALPAEGSALIWADLGFVSGDSRFDLLARSLRELGVLLARPRFGLTRSALGITFILRLGFDVVNLLLLLPRF